MRGLANRTCDRCGAEWWGTEGCPNTNRCAPIAAKIEREHVSRCPHAPHVPTNASVARAAERLRQNGAAEKEAGVS